jgi:hypothetical protein
LPPSRCIERRVLIKAENAQPSTPSCSGTLPALNDTPLRKSLLTTYVFSTNRSSTPSRTTVVGQAFLLAVLTESCGSTKFRLANDVATKSFASN